MYYGYGFAYVLLHILWWAVIIVLILWLIRAISGGGHRFPRNRFGGKDAMDILKERYAKGEINKEEFEQKKKDLMQS